MACPILYNFHQSPVVILLWAHSTDKTGSITRHIFPVVLPLSWLSLTNTFVITLYSWISNKHYAMLFIPLKYVSCYIYTFRGFNYLSQPLPHLYLSLPHRYFTYKNSNFLTDNGIWDSVRFCLLEGRERNCTQLLATYFT